MAVAKSYIGLKQVGEPYKVNNKMYVKVIMKSGAEKQVRWYTDAEYVKLYGGPVEECIKKIKTDKGVLGIEGDYFWIIIGETYENKEWLAAQGARYNGKLTWYFPTGEYENVTLPFDLQTKKVLWSEIGNEDESLKLDSEVKAAIESKIYPSSNSQFQGEIGDKLDIEVTVTKCVAVEGSYGLNYFHVMADTSGNIYTWTTSTKSWQEGTIKKIRGTVKGHNVYRNISQTVLTRCREIV